MMIYNKDNYTEFFTNNDGHKAKKRLTRKQKENIVCLIAGIIDIILLFGCAFVSIN